MRQMLKSTLEFLRREDGPTAVECALMLALVVIICIAATRQISPNGGAVGEPVMIVAQR